MPAVEMPKLSKFSNSEDKESIENIKSELSKKIIEEIRIGNKNSRPNLMISYAPTVCIT